jgi:hypothetical protein
MADPEQIITATLRNEDTPHPELVTKRLIADPAGHGYRITRDTTKVITYCRQHTSSKMPCQMPHDTERTT